MSKNLTYMIRDLERVRKTLNKLNPHQLDELVRRAGTRVTSPPSPSGPRGKGSVSDPTLSAVIRSEERMSDPIWEAVRDIATTLSDLASLSESIDAKLRFIASGPTDKQLVVHKCLACDREVMGTPSDRIRSGMCFACYRAWLREGRPYRDGFFRKIKAELAEKNNP